MSQNPFGTQPTGQPPYPQQSQLPNTKKSGTNTVLIVLGIVGGVLLLTFIACGVAAYMFVRNVKSEFEGVMADAMAEVEAEQQYESQFWVDTYRDHPMVQQQLGKVVDHQPHNPNWDDQFLEIEIDVTGEKGTGLLRIEYGVNEETGDRDDHFESTMNAFLIKDGNKQLLDAEAGRKYDEWSESDY